MSKFLDTSSSSTGTLTDAQFETLALLNGIDISSSNEIGMPTVASGTTLNVTGKLKTSDQIQVSSDGASVGFDSGNLNLKHTAGSTSVISMSSGTNIANYATIHYNDDDPLVLQVNETGSLQSTISQYTDKVNITINESADSWVLNENGLELPNSDGATSLQDGTLRWNGSALQIYNSGWDTVSASTFN